MMMTSPMVNVYPLSGYSFGSKEDKLEKDRSVADRLDRMKLKGSQIPKRRHENHRRGILLFQEHRHPHVLLLQSGNTNCKPPGGRLRPGEDEIEGLKRKLSSRLGPCSSKEQPDWQIGECVAIWWRPHFETLLYPYCPPHITKPKECEKLFLVHLSERDRFDAPGNLKLVAVPFFELFNNANKYGTVISYIPLQLSRFHCNLITP